MTLDLLPLDQYAVIQSVQGTGALTRRLLEMGLVPGTRICVTGQAPLGDPLELAMRGCKLTLRREDAALILVEKERIRFR